MLDVLQAFPDVIVDHDNRHFYEGLLRHELVLNRCGDCGTWHADPFRPFCSACLSWNIVHEPVSGRGRVYMMTRLHRGPAIPGVSYSPPIPLAAIELDEQPGLRVAGGLLGATTDFSAIGRRVELAWPAGQVAPRLVFQIVEGA